MASTKDHCPHEPIHVDELPPVYQSLYTTKFFADMANAIAMNFPLEQFASEQNCTIEDVNHALIDTVLGPLFAKVDNSKSSAIGSGENLAGVPKESYHPIMAESQEENVGKVPSVESEGILVAASQGDHDSWLAQNSGLPLFTEGSQSEDPTTLEDMPQSTETDGKSLASLESTSRKRVRSFKEGLELNPGQNPQSPASPEVEPLTPPPVKKQKMAPINKIIDATILPISPVESTAPIDAILKENVSSHQPSQFYPSPAKSKPELAENTSKSQPIEINVQSETVQMLEDKANNTVPKQNVQAVDGVPFQPINIPAASVLTKITTPMNKLKMAINQPFIMDFSSDESPSPPPRRPGDPVQRRHMVVDMFGNYQDAHIARKRGYKLRSDTYFDNYFENEEDMFRYYRFVREYDEMEAACKESREMANEKLAAKAREKIRPEIIRAKKVAEKARLR